MLNSIIPQSSKSDSKYGIYVLLGLTIAILFCFFGTFILSPNQHVFVIGGDGLFIYYNMLFQALFGDGITLASMNYPNYESLFMTDAQASISIIFSQIRKFFPGLAHYIIGSFHILAFLSILFCSCLLFLILKKLGVRTSLSITASILITFMSPQIERLVCGHFGLAYPHLIPLVIYWLFQSDNNWKLHLFVVFNLLFFGLNNIYISLILSSLIFVYLPLRWLLEKQERYLLVLKFGLSFTVLVAIFSIVKITDFYHDRVGIPWGFNYNTSSFVGLFVGNGSLVDMMLTSFSVPTNPRPEALAYLGLGPIICLIFLIVSISLKRIRKLHFISLSEKDKMAGTLLLASIIVLLIFNLLLRVLSPILPDFMNFIYQFRAPGRFAWIFYYAAGIVAAIVFERLLQYNKNRKLYVAITLLFISLWGFDAFIYINKTTKNIVNGNPYKQEERKKYRSIAEKLNISKETYHGFYLLPKNVAWTDKFDNKTHFEAYYFGFKFGIATGIPMVNGILSRISIKEALDNVQVVSNPLIYKEKIGDLDPSKSILLVHGNKLSLTENENKLLSISDTLLIGKRYSLFKINPGEYKSWYKEMILKTKEGIESSNKSWHFSSKNSICSKQSDYPSYDSSRTLYRGVIGPGKYEASVWVEVANRKYGLPDFSLKMTSKNADNPTLKQKTKLTDTADVFRGWARGSLFFESSDSAQIEFILDREKDFYFDQFMIREIGTNIVRRDGNCPDILWYNNFPIQNQENENF